MASRQDGLTLTRAGLLLHKLKEWAAFLGIVERWRANPSLADPLYLTASRAYGRPAYGIALRPLLPTSTPQNRATFHLMVCVRDPQQPLSLRTKAVNGLWGLSQSEGKLAAALVETGTLQRAARRCDITEGSARQYLKRIFHKTHTNGQVELVTLIMGLMPP